MVMLSSRLSSYPLSADSASRPLGRDGLESSLLSMQSNQPQPGQQLPVPQETPPNGQQNPYEFIFEQPGKPKRSLSGSKMTRILVVAGGAFLLLIVVSASIVQSLCCLRLALPGANLKCRAVANLRIKALRIVRFVMRLYTKIKLLLSSVVLILLLKMRLF